MLTITVTKKDNLTFTHLDTNSSNEDQAKGLLELGGMPPGGVYRNKRYFFISCFIALMVITELFLISLSS